MPEYMIVTVKWGDVDVYDVISVYLDGFYTRATALGRFNEIKYAELFLQALKDCDTLNMATARALMPPQCRPPLPKSPYSS